MIRLVDPAVTQARARDAAGGGPIEWTLLIGQASVMGADAETLAMIATSGRTATRLGDGTVLTLRPYALRVSAGESVGEPTSPAARMGKWLGVTSEGREQRWSSEAAGAAVGGAEGGAEGGGEGGAGSATVVVIEPQGGGRSRGGASTEGLLATRALSVRWLAPAPRDLPARLQEVFHRPLRDSTADSVWVRAAIAAARTSPLTRWRSRLAGGTLFAPGSDRFDDPVVESLARTIEAQWAHGLVRVAEADPLVARRLVEELCAVADFGGGVMAPVWEPEGPALATLLESLLEPEPATAEEVAAGWLAGRASAMCWVTDDAGASDPATGSPAGTLSAANLGAQPAAAWTAAAGAGGGARPGAEMVSVPARSVRAIAALSGEVVRGDGGATATNAVAEDAIRGVSVELRVGEESFLRGVHSIPIPAQAPGVVVAPFHADWSLAEWRAAGLDATLAQRFTPWSALPVGDAAWRTSGLVYRGIDAPIDQGAAMPDRWLLYLEMSAPAAGAGEGEAVRLWCGPSGKSRVVLRVFPDGRVIDDSPPGAGAAAARDLPRLVRVVRNETGWTCWIPLPGSAFETDGMLRLGVERTDARGVRSSWPRPLLPWQQEPGRIIIDPSRWALGK